MKTLTCLLVAACGSPGEVYRDVPYDVRFGNATTMDIHFPDSWADARPAIMMIHGGAWRYGSKADYDKAADRFAAAGYVTASINYRLVPAVYPAAIQDCLCALSFLRANASEYGIDPARIAVTGYSAGGHLSALVGTGFDLPIHQPDCEWGPTGGPAATIPGDASYDYTGDTSGWIVDFMGGTYDEMPDRYRTVSPLLDVRPGLAPFLVIHGRNDIVKVAYGEALVDTLRGAGDDVEFLELDGAGHIESPDTTTDGVYLQAASDTPEAWAAQLEFLARTLGGS
jgi:acetyl esterase/lipase